MITAKRMKDDVDEKTEAYSNKILEQIDKRLKIIFNTDAPITSMEFEFDSDLKISPALALALYTLTFTPDSYYLELNDERYAFVTWFKNVVGELMRNGYTVEYVLGSPQITIKWGTVNG